MTNIFENAKSQNRLAFMPFWPACFPNYDKSLEILKIIYQKADAIEFGIPFSDPSADGAINQIAYAEALKNGFKLPQAIKLVKDLLANFEVKKPIFIMCYLHLILQYGKDKFFDDFNAAGVAGYIIPDLTIDNRDILKENKLIFMTSSNSSLERQILIAKNTYSWMYFVTKPSTTGGINNISSEALKNVLQVKQNVPNLKVVAGFGIQNPNQLNSYKNGEIDGFIVASGLIKAYNNSEQEMISLLNSFAQKNNNLFL